MLEHFGPEGEGAALGRLRRMDAATVVEQERALFVGRFTETALVAGAIDVLGFEGAPRHAGEFGDALDVVFGQVDESLLVAAVDAAALAGETDTVFTHGMRGRQMAVWRTDSTM